MDDKGLMTGRVEASGHAVAGMEAEITQLLHDARYDEAFAACSCLFEIDPANAVAYEALGDIACAKGKTDLAAESYRRAAKQQSPRLDAIMHKLDALQHNSDLTTAVPAPEPAPATPEDDILPPVSFPGPSGQPVSTQQATSPLGAAPLHQLVIIAVLVLVILLSAVIFISQHKAPYRPPHHANPIPLDAPETALPGE